MIDEDRFLSWVESHNTPFTDNSETANPISLEESDQSTLERKIKSANEDRLDIFVHKSGLALKKTTESQNIQLVLNSKEREKLRKALV